MVKKLSPAVMVTPLITELVEVIDLLLAERPPVVDTLIDRIRTGAPLSADLAETLTFQLTAARHAGVLVSVLDEITDDGHVIRDDNPCDFGTDAEHELAFTDAAKWRELDEHVQGHGLTGLRMVLIESPFAGDITQEIDANKEYARRCMLDSIARGEAPYASHLLYTYVLADEKPNERKIGIACGFAWGRLAAATVVYTDRGISHGMRMGIANAEGNGRPVEYRTLKNP